MSLVIPSHHRTDLLRRCLASVARHAPAGTEVIVVDDGSPRQIVSAAATEFAGVRALRLSERMGFAAAVNAGVAAAQGDIVELLNDDTEVTAGWAAAALVHFSDPIVAAVAPLVLQADAGPRWPSVDSAGDHWYGVGVARKRGHGRPLTRRWLWRRPVFAVSGCGGFYRRALFLALGGFPVHFGAYFEDVDYSLRLRRTGHRVLYEPRSQLWHHGAASYGPPRDALLEQQSCNEERVFWRHAHGPTLLGLLPLHVGVVVAKAWRRWQRGELRPFLRGRWRAWRELWPSSA